MITIILLIFSARTYSSEAIVDLQVAVAEDCFRGVFENVDCEVMDGDLQLRTALKYANCMLASTGRAIQPCTPLMTTHDCFMNLSSDGMRVVTEYHVELAKICWQSKNFLFGQKMQKWINEMEELKEETLNSLGKNTELYEKHIGLNTKVEEQLRTTSFALECLKNLTTFLESTENSYRNFTVLARQPSALFQWIGESYPQLDSVIYWSLVLWEMLDASSVVFHTITFCVFYFINILCYQGSGRILLCILVLAWIMMIDNIFHLLLERVGKVCVKLYFSHLENTVESLTPYTRIVFIIFLVWTTVRTNQRQENKRKELLREIEEIKNLLPLKEDIR